MIRKIYWQIWAYFTRPMYYHSDHRPIKCQYCGGTKIDTIIKDDLNGITTEYSVICGDCYNEIGYWAYGYYDPSFSENLFYHKYNEVPQQI
jgi:hypothetical protein